MQFKHPAGGWDAWRTAPTVREQVKDITDQAKKDGRELTYKGKAHF